MVSHGYVLDLFASTLDQVNIHSLNSAIHSIIMFLTESFLYSQVGVAEMKVIIERTGGLVVLAESFGHSIFKDSFKHVFEKGEQSLGLAHK